MAVLLRAKILERVARYATETPPRSTVESLMRNWDPAQREVAIRGSEEDRETFWRPLRPLRGALSPKERAFAGTTAVTMTERQHIEASWRIESLQVLAWALGAVSEIPPYDREAAPDLAPNLDSTALRPAAEIERERAGAELWHWRCRTWSLAQAGRAFPATPQTRAAGISTFVDVVRIAAERAHADGTLPKLIDGDFPANGKAFRDLSEDEWSQVNSIAIERHFALNWLCGYAPGNRWDDTPVET